MKLTIPPLDVKENDQFKDDLFDRKPFGEALLNVAVNANDALVIALNSNWGEGKTTFLKMWQGLLEERKVPNIYIDAFAMDFVGDAFVSIASEITAYAKKHKVKEAELINKIKKVGGSLVSLVTRASIKIATLGIIKEADIQELSDIKDELALGTSNVIEKLIEERVTNHEKNLKAISSFR